MAGGLQAGTGLLWVDFADEPTERVEQALTDTFGFHPLAIQSALEKRSPPRLSDLGDHLYTAIHSLAPDAPDDAQHAHGALLDISPDRLATSEINVFLGANFLVTCHKSAAATPGHLWGVVQAHPDSLSRGPAFLLYYLVDAVVQSYETVIYQINDALDALEDQIFEDESSAPRATCLTLKRTLLELRQLLRPQREAIRQLSREPLTFVSDQDRIYFRDAYDDLEQVTATLNTLIGRVESVLTVYLSVVANRTNDVMKVLTVYTALFLPISFLAGFFGVNFPYLPLGLPEWIVFVSATLIVPVSLWHWFHRRGWV